MKVRDVMSTPVETILPTTPFAQVIDLLLELDVSGLPVVDDAGDLVGIVTEADLMAKEAYGGRRRRALGLVGEYFRGHDPQWVRKASGLTAGDIMTAAPRVADPDDDLGVIARRLLETGRKRLPVVDSAGKVVGIVTRHDVLRRFAGEDDETLGRVNNLLHDPLRAPEQMEVVADVTNGVVRLTGSVQFPRDVDILRAMVGRLPGVVLVDSLLAAREDDPVLTPPLYPPLV